MFAIGIGSFRSVPTAATSTIQQRKKQKSEILTETPNKDVLLACETKKKARQANLEKKLKQKSSKKGKASAKHPAKNKKAIKRKVFEESESEQEI